MVGKGEVARNHHRRLVHLLWCLLQGLHRRPPQVVHRMRRLRNPQPNRLGCHRRYHRRYPQGRHQRHHLTIPPELHRQNHRKSPQVCHRISPQEFHPAIHLGNRLVVPPVHRCLPWDPVLIFLQVPYG